jgi:hypothetical protein
LSDSEAVKTDASGKTSPASKSAGGILSFEFAQAVSAGLPGSIPSLAEALGAMSPGTQAVIVDATHLQQNTSAQPEETLLSAVAAITRPARKNRTPFTPPDNSNTTPVSPPSSISSPPPAVPTHKMPPLQTPPSPHQPAMSNSNAQNADTGERATQVSVQQSTTGAAPRPRFSNYSSSSPSVNPASSAAAIRKNYAKYVYGALAAIAFAFVIFSFYRQTQQNNAVEASVDADRAAAKASADSALAKLSTSQTPTAVVEGAPVFSQPSAQTSLSSSATTTKMPQTGEERYEAMLNAMAADDKKNSSAQPSQQSPKPVQQPDPVSSKPKTPAPSPSAAPVPIAVELNPGQLPVDTAPKIPRFIEGSERLNAVAPESPFASYGDIVSTSAVTNSNYVLLDTALDTNRRPVALIGHRNANEAAWLALGDRLLEGFVIVRITQGFVLLQTPDGRVSRMVK